MSADESAEHSPAPVAGDAAHTTPTKDPAPASSPFSSFNFNIWPPTRRTRDAVVNRLVETLSSHSVLTQRYAALPAGEADSAARRIEEEAFASATAAFESRPPPTGPDDDAGIDILQLYSKEISKRMLETIKAKGPAAPAVPADLTQSDPAATAPASEDASEDTSPVKSEPSSA